MKLKRYNMVLLIGVLSSLLLKGQNIQFNKYSNKIVEDLNIYLNGNVYQKDFLLFVNMIETTHPAFSNTSPIDIDSLRKDGYTKMALCKSVADFRFYLQSALSHLKDGHSTLLPDYKKSMIYPFAVFLDDDKKIYLRGISEGMEEYLGKEISEVNGHTILKVVESFKTLISGDNIFCFYKNVVNVLPVFSLWKNTSNCFADSSLCFTFSDSTRMTLKPVHMNELNIIWKRPDSCRNSVRQDTKMPFIYKIYSDKSICYLQFNSCIDQKSLLQQYYHSRGIGWKDISDEVEKKILLYPRFDSFLENMFKEVEAGGIKTLVVDVRNNRGGNSMLCKQLLSWLKPIKEINKSKVQIRFSKLWEQQYPLLSEKYKNILSNKGDDYELGRLYDVSYLSLKKDSFPFQKNENIYTVNTDSDKVFNGNVIFIQNSNTYSSAGMLVTESIDNEIGLVVGGNSSYKPCSYGDLLAWELPNTKVKGYVSHKVFNRPNMDECDESHIRPTVYIPNKWSDFLVGNDACWDWIVKMYSEGR